jgi:hypothetical protein
MIAAGLVAVFLAVPAERKALEDVARPFTAARDWTSSKRKQKQRVAAAH